MSAPAARILMVEDDPEIGRLVGDFLRREGFELILAQDARAMDESLSLARPDLLILDLMLPGEDGLSICRRLRASDSLPILMLTAKSDEIDRVVGLEMGADDYLTKPFGPRELLARVRALLRRAQAEPSRPASRRYSFDRFVLDLDARNFESAGAPIALTSAEFDLLACFAQHPRRVLTRDQLLDWTHGRNADPFDRAIDMLVSRLRKKLDAAGASGDLIATVRNGGYLFKAEVRRLS
ncbi:DNA-binding response OmpR family regulator [Methylosinus sp. sav-2]|uniref:response regulator n=1 Tax=unclassified Methylosinus TaxID=2624500 RepID=UPI0004632FFA|nr:MULTISPECIES: response regulator transcription factor [unclassified Methylosinus]TDX62722.1 DNA-binding response OmpR family regulator [Methylosinus sp. sav-2]